MCVCVCACVRACVCVCVCVCVIVKRPVLPPSVVDGRYKNPVYYYYYALVLNQAQFSQLFMPTEDMLPPS